MKTKRIRGTYMDGPDLFDENDCGFRHDLFDGIVDFFDAPMEDIEVDIAAGDLDAELASPLDDLTTLSCIFGTDAPKREERKKLPPVSNKAGQEVTTAESSTPSAPDAQRKCMHCKVTTTPQWKRGPLGPNTLCNGCGLGNKSGRLYSPTFVAPSHSNFQRKVEELANIVENTSSRSTPLLIDFPRNKRSSPRYTPGSRASKRFHPLAASAPFYESSDYPKAHFPKNKNKAKRKRKKLSGLSDKSSLVEIKIKGVHEDAIAASSIFLEALHSNSREKVVETVDKTEQKVAVAASPTSVASLSANSPKKNPLQGKIDQEVALAANKNSWQVKVKDRKCLHCGVKSTPLWRNGPLGLSTLCNACGVRYRSGRIFPEYRPLASPTFVASLHSNSHSKVLEMRKKVGNMAALTTTNGNKCLARFDLDELPDLNE